MLNECIKTKCPLMNPINCKCKPTECPYYTPTKMNRRDAINILKTLKANCPKYFPEYQALELAIASLKTDDYYELMSEDVETYTKADFIAMLEEIRLVATKMKDSQINILDYVIQEKINKLKGENNVDTNTK